MVEASNQDGFKPSEAEEALIKKHLGNDAIVDAGYKANVNLTKSEAEYREKLIEDVEYDFQLALNKGGYYLGNAVINFYLRELPGKGRLFLSSQAMAVSDLIINDEQQNKKEAFQKQ